MSLVDFITTNVQTSRQLTREELDRFAAKVFKGPDPKPSSKPKPKPKKGGKK